MDTLQLNSLIRVSDRYNLHSHTQFCDGRTDMEGMAAAACAKGFTLWGFTPHSPVNQKSSCNMAFEKMDEYLAECRRLAESYSDRMRVLASLEIDYISPDFGPHTDYFQKLPLDYRLASVHFVPNRHGVWLDCDGRFERFESYLREGYDNDLRYVVEKYFEQVILMLEGGGFEILGHFDKIAGNASAADPGIESNGWYEALVDDVISHASSAGVTVEINTKSFADKGRFFPASQWWPKIIHADLPVAVNSDTHYADKTDAGRGDALELLQKMRSEYSVSDTPA